MRNHHLHTLSFSSFKWRNAQHPKRRTKRMQAGGSNGICRVIDAARSPSPDPKRSANTKHRNCSMMTEAELIATANALAGEFRTSEDCCAGGVAAAIMSASGRVYTGICVDTQCRMGFCAEHAAVAEMLKARESEIALVVAVVSGCKVVAPCGRCRELMWQVSPRNRHAMVVIGPGHQVMLSELLPYGG
jgi:cytidine deaminase